MNPETVNERPVWHIGLAFLIGSFLFAGFVFWVKSTMPVPAINADRAAERNRDLSEVRAAETQALNNPGWIDQSRGVVRLPIDVAMKMAAQEWQNPATARANLIDREEKATAPAPVKPAVPSAFE